MIRQGLFGNIYYCAFLKRILKRCESILHSNF